MSPGKRALSFPGTIIQGVPFQWGHWNQLKRPQYMLRNKSIIKALESSASKIHHRVGEQYKDTWLFVNNSHDVTCFKHCDWLVDCHKETSF